MADEGRPVDLNLASACRNAELEALSGRYGLAIDRRDRAALLSVFHSDAQMRVLQPGREPGVLRGHDQLGRLTAIITRWPRTMHLMAQGLYEVDGEEASGEAYCTAHHFSSQVAGEGRDHVMYIRYQDHYRVGAEGQWQIAHRTVVVDATEDRPVHFGVDVR